MRTVHQHTTVSVPRGAGLTPSLGCRTGMTFVELLLSVAVCAVMLGGVTLVSESLRHDQSDQETRATLRSLRKALNNYYSQHQYCPAGETASTVLKALLADKETAAVVCELRLSTDAAGVMHVQDGYGRSMRYIIRDRGAAAQADFVSAGPDGRFGDLSSPDPDLQQASLDDLYGADLETPSP